MLDHELDFFNSVAWDSRILFFFVMWLGIFYVVFAADALDCCCRSKHQAPRRGGNHSLYACGSSGVISFILQVSLCTVAFLAFSSLLMLMGLCVLLVFVYAWQAGAMG